MDPKDATDLLLQHRRLIHRLARRFGRAEAEDLANEAFARALCHPAPDGRSAPWLERISRNLGIDAGRRRGRAAANLERAPALTVAAPNPEERLLEAERRSALGVALGEIPSEMRSVLVARYFDDRAYEDVAAAQGITPTTARTRAHRALERLRVALGGLRATFPFAGLGHARAVGVALMPVALTAVVGFPGLVGPTRVAAEAPLVRVEPRAHGHASSELVVPLASSVAALPSLPLPGLRLAHADTTPRRQTTQSGARPPAPEPAHEPKPLHLDFDNEDVVGEIQRPEGDWFGGAPRAAKHESLIEIPRTFAPAIIKSLEEI